MKEAKNCLQNGRRVFIGTKTLVNITPTMSDKTENQ